MHTGETYAITCICARNYCYGEYHVTRSRLGSSVAYYASRHGWHAKATRNAFAAVLSHGKHAISHSISNSPTAPCGLGLAPQGAFNQHFLSLVWIKARMHAKRRVHSPHTSRAAGFAVQASETSGVMTMIFVQAIVNTPTLHDSQASQATGSTSFASLRCLKFTPSMPDTDKLVR